MRIQKSGDQYSITLPKKLIEAMGWKKGNKVEFIVAGKSRLEMRLI